jgi:hypothetical protein
VRAVSFLIVRNHRHGFVGYYRHSMESREPVEAFLVHGLEGLLAVLRTLFLLHSEKKSATLGRFRATMDDVMQNIFTQISDKSLYISMEYYLAFLLGTVLGIRIRRIRMFLGLLGLDPLVRGTDPQHWVGRFPPPFSKVCIVLWDIPATHFYVMQNIFTKVSDKCGSLLRISIEQDTVSVRKEHNLTKLL